MRHQQKEAPIRVLLVEDDRDDFFLTQDVLHSVSKDKYAVVWAGCYDTARQYLIEERFDVALVDYHIGDRTGLQFITEESRRAQNCPMILLTGVDNPDVDRAAEQAGAADFLVKDALTPDLLDRTIRYARKHAERSALLGAIIDNSDVGMIALRADGIPQIWNREVLRALSLAQGDTVEVDARDVIAALVKLAHNGRLPHEFTTEQGETFELSNSSVPGGKVIVFQNVTRRVRNEALLRQTARDAEAASLAKSGFLATMSHELRTPLNGILGMVRVLETSTEDETQLDCLRTIKSSGLSLLGIINDVLDISKIEAGKFELDNVEFELPKLLDEVVSLLAPNALEKGVDLSLQVAPEVPRLMMGDPARLRQVVVNLVGNAVKFTTEGAVTLRANRRDISGGHQLEIEVIDTGIGMSVEDQAKLFQKFSQVDSSLSRRNGGTGLGLALCREITGLMGGQIACYSEHGQGSTFTVTLPCPEGDPAIETASRSKLARLAGSHLLLISRSRALPSFLEFHLGASGLKITHVATEQEMADVLATARVEAIVFDQFAGAMPSAALQRLARSQEAAGSPKYFCLSADQLDAGLAGFHGLPRPLTAKTVDQIVAGMSLQPRAAAAQQSRPTASAWKKPLRILVAEDNEPNQRVLRALMHSAGYTPTLVENGRQAVDTCLAGEFDVVLMDVSMPIMDGLEATRLLRKHDLTKYVPIIGLTANAMSSHRQDCLNAGMNDYLSKPVDWDALFALLSRLERELYGATTAA